MRLPWKLASSLSTLAYEFGCAIRAQPTHQAFCNGVALAAGDQSRLGITCQIYSHDELFRCDGEVL